MILPNNNISIMSVRNCIGEPSSDLGTLCISNKVNMWSKYKPVKLNTLNTNSNPNWYKGDDLSCGINMPKSGHPDTVKNQVWTRQIPTGGSSSPYRLGDFRGYNSSAQRIISGRLYFNETLQTDSKLQLKIDLYHNAIDNNLQFTDIDKLKNMYYGLLIEDYTKTQWIVTSDKTCIQAVDDSGILRINLDFQTYPFNSRTGAYRIVQFLTPSKYTTPVTFPSVIDCYSVYNDSAKLFNEAKINYSSYSSNFEATLMAVSDSISGTFKNIEPYEGWINAPFIVSLRYASEQFFKIKLKYTDTSIATKRFDFSWLSFSAENVLGDSVDVNDKNPDNRYHKYDGNKTPIYGDYIDLKPNIEQIVYIGVKLFNADDRGGQILSGQLTNAQLLEVVKQKPSLIRGLYYDQANNKNYWLGRGEIEIKGLTD